MIHVTKRRSNLIYGVTFSNDGCKELYVVENNPWKLDFNNIEDRQTSVKHIVAALAYQSQICFSYLMLL